MIVPVEVGVKKRYWHVDAYPGLTLSNTVWPSARTARFAAMPIITIAASRMAEEDFIILRVRSKILSRGLVLQDDA